MKLITALATPFLKGKIDLNSYTKLLVRQQHADALLCCGTTGEGALLAECEKKLLVHTTKALLPQKELWVGVNNGATAAAIREATFAEQWGADGILVAPPAFFKCTESGFVRHVTEICRAVKIPVMLYNAPGRCGYTIWQTALDKLAVLGVHCIKDAGSDLVYARHAQNKMQLLCGNEQMLQQFVQCGASGVVSVVANISPQLVKIVWEIFERELSAESHDNTCKSNCINATSMTNCKANNFETSNVENCQDNRTVKLFAQLADLCFCQINPIAVKYLLRKQGIFASDEMRLPLTQVDEATCQNINAVWKAICDKIIL